MRRRSGRLGGEGGFAPASGRTGGGGRRPGRGGLAVSMKKRIPRSGGAWRGSWRGGREGFGGLPSGTSDFSPRFKASSTLAASSLLGEF